MGRGRPQASPAANRRRTPGERLRALRVVRGLSLRDVHQASLRVAKRLRNEDFLLPPSRLHEIEARSVVPSIHRLYTLASIYDSNVMEFLDWYGIPQQNIPKPPARVNAD
jgi:transcriptional regulator with XRE-family HTH domain